MAKSQDPIQLQIALSILPGERNGETIALATTIGREIFNHLSAEHYQIKPVDTGTLGLGEFLILISVLVTQAVQILGQGVADKLGETVIDHVTKLVKRIFRRTKTSTHKDVPASLVVKISHDCKIEVHGPLGVIFGEVARDLEERKEQYITKVKNGNILGSNQKRLVLTVYLPDEQETL